MSLSIKAWAEDERPREKMQLKGRSQLTDAELLAILLGSGNTELSAVGLARQILSDGNNDLHALSRKTLRELMQYKGIGLAKAVSVVAALELGRRRAVQTAEKVIQIRGSQDAFRAVGGRLQELDHEEFWILLLNRANHIIGQECISKGGISGTVVDARLIFRHGIQALASGLILFHNHPSGNLKPSQQDLDLTQKLKASGKLLEIPILDHLIIGNQEYLSFADEGLL